MEYKLGGVGFSLVALEVHPPAAAPGVLDQSFESLSRSRLPLVQAGGATLSDSLKPASPRPPLFVMTA